MKTQKTNLDKMTKVALLIAISTVLIYFNFPILPMFPWLEIDLSEVPALMGGFAYGPVTGGVIVVVKVLLKFLLQGTKTAFVGEVANILIGLALVVPATWIYHRNKSKKTAIGGIVIGALIMQVVGILANIYILLPLYGMQMSSSELMNYVIVGIVPFNGVKAALAGVSTYLLYKRVSATIFKVDSKFNKKAKNALN